MFRAIDLYSGIGGWTLGMKLNGINHEMSFEWNKESNTTHNNNFGTDTPEKDIRKLNFSSLPEPGSIDFVVGSPPCTQFSLANRGGNGNIEDGLIDMYQFLKVVEYLKPKYWAMENVPRVKSILEKVLNEDKKFMPFKKMFNYIEVIDASEYGTPQRRKRMIAGNFPFELFESYKKKCPIRTLGDVVNSLKEVNVVDPVYEYKIPFNDIEDHIIEKPLNSEELRLNRESKNHHPIYNKMAFPEDLSRASRTITSTCTRVSRESLILEDETGFRRLSVRERAMLMGFPISFQFYGKSYGAKLKMIGNAIPPTITYYLFQSMKEIPFEKMVLINKVRDYVHFVPKQPVPSTLPETAKFKYRDTRSFRLAIPKFRFGSGVRFEFANSFNNENVKWGVNFFYGNSKKIRSIELNAAKLTAIEEVMNSEKVDIIKELLEVRELAETVDSQKLQGVWTHKSNEHAHPYEIMDKLSKLGEGLSKKLKNLNLDKEKLEEITGPNLNKKLIEDQQMIISGILIGSVFNQCVR